MANEIRMFNGYCFLKNFKHLSLLDLVNVKKTYTYLSDAADMAFLDKTRGTLYFYYEDQIDETLQIINQFGRSVNELLFNFKTLQATNWSEIFSAIGEHCNENLNVLALSGDAVASMTETDVLSIVDILKRVETIHLLGNVVYPKEFILSHCENVKSIHLSMPAVGNDVAASTLFRRNKNLLKLKLHGRLSDRAFETIVDSLMKTRLEELTMNFNAASSRLPRLRCLQRLNITCYDHSDIVPFLRIVDGFASLNVLSLRFSQLNRKEIAMLGRMTRSKVLILKSFSADSNFHFDSVLVLCGNKNFEHLTLECYGEAVDEVKYSRIVERRKASAAENCLHLTFDRSIYTASLVAIPCGMLEANEETVKLIDRNDCGYV